VDTDAFRFQERSVDLSTSAQQLSLGFVRLPPHEEDEVDVEVMEHLKLTNSAEDREKYPPRTDSNGEKWTVFDYNRPVPGTHHPRPRTWVLH